MHNNDLDILLELEKETLNEQKEIIEVKEIQNNFWAKEKRKKKNYIFFFCYFPF